MTNETIETKVPGWAFGIGVNELNHIIHHNIEHIKNVFHLIKVLSVNKPL